ncbi:MAG: amidase, partial [Acidobacteriota bacterium]|nr:amidase [Acidobacteriota bacterium]
MEDRELPFAGIARQLEEMAAGELTSRGLVEMYLRRIERLNGSLNAYRVVFAERALLEADQADARRRAGEGEGGGGGTRPLLGIPFAVKEDIDVAGEVTTFGTRAYGEPARADAEIVRRLRAAGAVVLGKTNVPELCAVPWTESATWGITRNPWNLEHTPGGSSGGSAAAVAAGLASAALGSDGGGSIRFPAAYCGLFGLKGQRGRLPLAPHDGGWAGLAVNAVLTRTVRDTAIVYDALAEGPPDAGAPVPAPVSLLGALAGAGTSGATAGEGATEARAGRLRIGVSTNLPPSPLTRLHADNEAAVRETAELLRGLGHEVGECELDHGPMAPPLEFSARVFAGVHEDAMSLAHPERLERWLRAIVRIGGLIGPRVLPWSLAREAAYAERMNRPFAEFDVLLTPVTPAPAPHVGRTEGRGWMWKFMLAAATVPYA